MHLLIIRHGESEADILRCHEGRADFNLTQRGHAQAEAMAQRVASEFKVTRILASPLKRAAQTAGHLSEAVGLPIEFDEDLMEHNNGLLAGLTYEEADRLYPKVENLPVDQSVYGQESMVEFRARAERALKKIMALDEPDAVVAVVSHGGTIHQLYSAMLGLPVTADFRFFLTGDTGIHLWQVKDGAVRVLAANLTEHTKGI